MLSGHLVWGDFILSLIFLCVFSSLIGSDYSSYKCTVLELPGSEKYIFFL